MTKLLPGNFSFDGPFPRLSRRLRLGVIGGGRISAIQAMAARMIDRWEVMAGALSSDPEKARARDRDWHLTEERCYASFEEMATRESERVDGVDAVMITTPNHVHFDAANVFLDAGIDILCDKPLVNTVAEAEDLLGWAERSGVVFAVGYVMSCFPMVHQAKAIARSGTLDEIVQIHAEFMQDWMVPGDVGEADHVKWRLDPAKSGATSCTGPGSSFARG